MGSMENGYGLVPPQPGRRKRHADDGTLGGRYTDVKRNVENVQWDDSQKRSQVVIHRKSDRVGPRMTWARIQCVVGSRLVNRSGRDSSC